MVSEPWRKSECWNGAYLYAESYFESTVLCFETCSSIFFMLIGFYCPEGQTVPTPTEFKCWAGYYCEENTITPQLCPSGQYQNQEQQSDCVVCPQGSCIVKSIRKLKKICVFAEK